MKKFVLSALALTLSVIQPVLAATTSPTDTAPQPVYKHAIFVYHPATGTVLEAENADEQMGPASLTKLMTLYLTFDALKSGRIHLTDMVPISEKAWRTGGSKMFVEVGTKVSVEDLIKGIAIDSGNDACVAIAEYLGGTEAGFAEQMNAKARELGMSHTHYVDSNGLPNPQQVSTAHDIAMLLTAIFRDFPEDTKYLREEDFTFNGIHQNNRNGLLHTDIGIDAGKTGHTDESGYHLASTAVQHGERLVVVVMGTNSFGEREGQSMQAYRTFFNNYVTRTLFKPGDVVVKNVPVWHGASGEVNLMPLQPIAAYINPYTESDKIKAQVTYNKPLMAPMAADKPVGELTVTLPSGQQFTTALVPDHPIHQAGFVRRFTQSLLDKLGFGA